MNKDRIIRSIVAIGFFGICFLGCKIYIESNLDLIDVPVVSTNLSPRTLITEADLIMVKMPKAYLQPSILLDSKHIVGKYTLINTGIPSGSFIYASMVEPIEDAKDYPALLLHPEQVVYALDVDLKMTSGNTLQPFQSIDLYVSLIHNRLTVVDRLIRNVRILSLKDKNGKDLDQATDIPKIMLIALNQDLVPILTKALELGELIITPISKVESDQECILVEDTSLITVLYER